MQTNFHIPSCPVLKPAVDMFWQVERTSTQIQRETIVPKGTVEIIFNLYETKGFEAKMNSRVWSIPRCFLSGHHTGPIQMLTPREQTMFGVNISAVTACKIFQIEAPDFANQCMDLTLADTSIDSIWHQLGDATLFEERVTIFSNWMIKRITDLTARERMLDQFIFSKEGNYSVSELSKTLCYSSRQLSRKLYALTGMNTEQTLLYKKYLHSVRLIHHSDFSLTAIAHHCGFSDQSHFIKTFRSFTGTRPNEYRAVKSHIESHVFEYVR